MPREIPMPHVPGAEHRFVVANGLRFHVAEAGSGDPLLLLHGWPQHWYEWRHLIGPLSADRRVICPDMRGFGWSEAPPGGYDIETAVADLIALMDALDIDRAGVIGHDWGAFFGWHLCLAFPERISGLVALAVPHPWPVVDRKAASAMRHFWYQAINATPIFGPALIASFPAYVQMLIRHWSGPDQTWSEDDLDVYTSQFSDPARARASSRLYRDVALRGSLSALRGRPPVPSEVPSVALFGAADRCIAPSWGRGLEARMPSAKVEIVTGAGHFLPEERPDAVLSHAREIFG